MRAFKLSGAGNDFIFLAEPESDPSPDQTRAWCRRRESIGADGVCVLEHDVEHPDSIRLRYWNADGGRARLCFNATRCAARLAHELGWTGAASVVTTDAGAFPATVVDASTVRMAAPGAEEGIVRRAVALEDGSTVEGWWLRVGVPHFVLVAAPLETIDVTGHGRTLRHHPDFGEEGTNVNFVSFEAPHTLPIRTFERGVEAEVLACGSGILAAAAVGIEQGSLRLPIEVHSLGGLPLRLEAASTPRERGFPWALVGDARLVAELLIRA